MRLRVSSTVLRMAEEDPTANERDALAGLRDRLAGGVVLSAQRIQEALDEAVEAGRMTGRDAEQLARTLLGAGRRQTADFLAALEQLVVPGAGDRVLRSGDRVRRTAGVGPAFPILGFEDLTARQVLDRLDGLTPAQLRKVRDAERRGEARKTVLAAIERKLA